MKYIGQVNQAALDFVIACLDRGGYVSSPTAEDRIRNVWYEGMSPTGKVRYRTIFWNADREESAGFDTGHVFIDMSTLKGDYYR